LGFAAALLPSPSPSQHRDPPLSTPPPFPPGFPSLTPKNVFVSLFLFVVGFILFLVSVFFFKTILVFVSKEKLLYFVKKVGSKKPRGHCAFVKKQNKSLYFVF
jgi:hypothetical protein